MSSGLQPAAVAALWSLLGGGCKGTPERVSFPEAVTHIASISVRDGRLAEASPLTPAADALLAVHDREPGQLILGFELGALSELVGPERLRAAVACDARLPAPIWAVEWDGRRFAPIEETPPLTVDWLDDSCPLRGPEDVAVQRVCVTSGCTQQVTRRSACTFSVDLSACEGPAYELRIQPDGSSCVLESERPCAPTAEAGEAVAAFSCPDAPDCEVRAFTHLSSAEAPFSVERVALVDDVRPEYLPRGIEQRIVANGRLTAGYITDFAAMDSGRLVVVGADRVVDACAHEAADPRTTWFVDPASLEVVSSRSAGVCLTRVAGRPGGGFFGGFLSDGRWHIGRFDEDGALEASVEADPDGRIDNIYFQLEFLMADAASGRLVASFGDIRGNIAPGLIFVYDPDSLTLLGEDALDHHAASALDLRDGTILMSAASARSLHWFDVQRSSFVEAVTLGTKEISRTVYALHRDALDPDRLLLTSQFAVEVFEGLGRQAAAEIPPIRYDIDMVHIAPWTLDGGLVLVAGIAPSVAPKRRAVVAVLDVAEGRFRPGVFDVGHGIIGAVLPASGGGVIATLPYAGELVRLDPR